MRIWLLLMLLMPLWVQALEINGHIGTSVFLFSNDPSYSQQHTHKQQWSLIAEAEFYQAWNDDQDSLLFKPYARIDQYDKERSHFDIRELLWLHAEENWELRTGISKVFWGVNEFNHLVDIINQDDLVDNITSEEKLGQPMINLTLLRDWGTIDLFILPGFRERTFPGKAGRLRSPAPVDTDNAQYESSAGNKHVDFSLRWSHTFDDYDVGIYYFRGTNRDPHFIPVQQSDGEFGLIPYYDQIDQFGMDFQATLEDWLWKLEMIKRKGKFDNYAALSGGFEYTFYTIFDSSIDLGIITEYSWDERNDPSIGQFQNDIMFGSRFAFNDAQSSELLAGWIQNVDQSKLRSFQIEASRRLGDSWKISLDLRLFSDHKYNPVSEDDHIQLTLKKFF